MRIIGEAILLLRRWFWKFGNDDDQDRYIYQYRYRLVGRLNDGDGYGDGNDDGDRDGDSDPAKYQFFLLGGSCQAEVGRS